MNLGQRIKEARLSAGLSQVELARAIGLEGTDAGSPLCKWESGEREPRFHNLVKIAGALQLPIGHFIQAGVVFAPALRPGRSGCYKGRSGRPKGSLNKKGKKNGSSS